MAQIFLSYAREDRDCAVQLARVLEDAGHCVWWDRRIGGGEEFGTEIEAELDNSEVVLVAWSRQSVKSRWVRDEAAVGGDRGILLPISIDGSRPPMGFRQFHTLDLTGWKGGTRDARTAELLQSVQRRVKGKGKPPPPGEPLATAKRSFHFGPRKRLWAISTGLVVVLITVTGFYFLHGRDQIRGPIPKPVIGLLPLSTATSDPELKNLAAQSRDSITHAMSQSGMPVRLVDTISADRGSKTDFWLSGELNKNGDNVIATMRLVEAIQGVTVLTQRFEAGSQELHDLPSRIGAQVAGNLSDGSTLLILDRRHPMDPALMADLLGSFTGDPLQTYQTTKRVVSKAPDSPSALISLAFFTGFVLEQLPLEERSQAVAEARRAADRALELAPEFGDTYVTWCLLHNESRMAECEDRIREGKRVDSDAPYLNLFLAAILRQVGRFNESVELTRLSYSHDPYNPFKIKDMLQMFESSGKSEEARDLSRQALRWYPEIKVQLFSSRLTGLIFLGDFAGMASLEQEVGADALPSDYVKSAPIVSALKSKSRPALGRACAGQEATLALRCMIAAAAIGDQDGAYAIADKLYPRRVGRTPAQTEQIWLDDPGGVATLALITSPAAAPMRRDKRYLALAERVGLLAYWRSGRPPDFCRKNPEPICAKLVKANR